LPPNGAARLYIADADWQTKVADLLHRCQCMVLVMGRVAEHPGLAWELQQVVVLGRPEKLLFLMPPVKEEEARARWDMFREAKHFSLPPFEGGELAVEFDSLGRAAVVHRSASGNRDLTAYEAVLKAEHLGFNRTKVCPHCGELLPLNNSFCRHCRNWLT
jgi:hypothetical protein